MLGRRCGHSWAGGVDTGQLPDPLPGGASKCATWTGHAKTPEATLQPEGHSWAEGTPSWAAHIQRTSVQGPATAPPQGPSAEASIVPVTANSSAQPRVRECCSLTPTRLSRLRGGPERGSCPSAQPGKGVQVLLGSVASAFSW